MATTSNSTASDQGTWEWVWNQYTSLGEHGVLKNTKTGEQVLTEPRSFGDKQGIQQLAEPLTSLLNDPEFSGYAKIHSTIPLSAIDSGIQVPLDSLKDPRSYDDTWKTEFREEKQISNLMRQLAGVVDLPNSSGGAWTTKSGKRSGPGYGPEGFLHVMAENFINQTGLTDLNKLGTRSKNILRQTYIYKNEDGNYFAYTGDPDNEFDYTNRLLTPQEISTIRQVPANDEYGGYYTVADVNVGTGNEYYNKDTGAPVRFDGTLGEYNAGPDYTRTKLSFTPEGKPRVTTQGDSSNDLVEILPILSIALMAIPGIGQAVGAALLPTGVSAATATAVGNAVVNAGLQVAAGAPVEQALTNAAASLGVSQLVPNLSGNSFVDNAVRSVATATLTGGDVEKALANSLIATGGNEVLGNVSFTGNATVDSAIASAITSGVQAAATDGDVGQSIARGFAAGTSGQITNEERMAESARSGAGFVGEDVTENMAESARSGAGFIGEDVTENMAESARSGAGFIGEDVTEPITLTGGASTGDTAVVTQAQDAASTGDTAVVTQAPDAALQAEAEKILRMAVRRETPDLRYDVNKDGRVTAADAFLVASGRATIPTVEQNADVDLNSTDYAEAEAFLGELGYTPTEDEIKQFVGQVNEDATKANIAGYVNPRQVTEAEAREFLEANGYTPTEDEIKKFVGQVNEDATKADIVSYVDPRQFTEAEARQVLTDLGVDPESEYGKDLIAEYTKQGDETQLIDQLTAGADSFIRTPKTVGDLLKLATNPVAYVLSPVSGEISKLVTGTITNAIGADNLDTQTKALIKTASAAVVNGAFAKLLGGDFKKAALGTVVGTALNALPIPGTKDLFEGAKKDLTFNQIVDRISTSALSAAGLDVDSKFGTRIVDGTNSAIRAGLIAYVAGGNEKQILINTGTAFLGGAFGNTKLSKDVSKKLDTFGNELTEDVFDENGILRGLDPVDKIVVQGKSDTDTGIEEATGIIGSLALMKRFTKDDVAPVSDGSGQNSGSGGQNTSVTVTATRESCAADGKEFDETTNQCVDLVDVIGSGGGGQDTVSGGGNGQDTVSGGQSVEVTATRESCAAEGKEFDETTNQCVDLVDVIGGGSGQNSGSGGGGGSSVTVTATRESCAADGMGFDETTKECVYIGDFTGGGGGGQDSVGGGSSVTVTGCGPGKTRDPETGLCLETVEEDEECPPGQVDTGFGCQDITAGPCDPGFHDENGLCVADTDEKPPECPAGEVRNLNTGLCEAVQPDPCPAGYKRNAAGECEIQVQYQPLPSFFGIDNLLKDRGGGAGYSPNLREKFMATRTYTPPPEDYDYFTDPYFQRFGPISYVPLENYAGAGKAEGGLMSLAKGGRTSLPPRYLDGHSDGMADQVPASIDNSRPAALSDGEFVIPADVVSHLGNGNSNAGAKVLYAMMDRIRRARTGNSKQGKQINPSKFIPR